MCVGTHGHCRHLLVVIKLVIQFSLNVSATKNPHVERRPQLEITNRC